MKTKPVILSSLLVLLACSLPLERVAASPPSGGTPLVVTTKWLAEHLDDPDLIVLHIGPKGSYEEGHVPGARKASLRQLVRVNEAGIRDEMPPAADLSSALAELGIENNSRIVVCFSHEAAAWAAARYLLTLEYAGMSGRAAYLDGGLPAWKAEGRAVATEAPSFEPTGFSATVSPDVVVDTAWLQARLDQSGIAIVDGRPAEGYSGVSGHWDRLGHIPGAANIPFTTLLAADPPYMLKNRDDIIEMFAEAGARPGNTVVVYCGTGMWASLPYLAARYAGYDVRLYDGSFQEWSATEHLPVVASGSHGKKDG